MSERYDPKTTEEKWQRVWAEARAGEVANPETRPRPSEPKSYVLEMLPYPSGTLHMGHMLVYTIGDVVTRFRRRNGIRVLHPMGWDAFGLPAENAAIKEGGHPREITERNIVSIRGLDAPGGLALRLVARALDARPALLPLAAVAVPALPRAGLAYRKGAPVKWCPNDQTVIANEQVLPDGTCERCGARGRVADHGAVVLPHHGLRGRAPGRSRDRRLAGVDQGAPAELDRPLRGRARSTSGSRSADEDVTVFTTRPDTLFGATFFVLAPEHDARRRGSSREEVQDVRPPRRCEEDRGARAAVEKTGVFTGLHAINPVNGERLPVYVADYVLTDYGTGAIMAVPAHDQRDFDFAGRSTCRCGRSCGRPTARSTRASRTSRTPRARCSSTPASSTACRRRRAAGGSSSGSRPRARAASTVNYRLRDWGFSRQRYWGCPIPIVYCDACGIVPVPDERAAGRAARGRGLQAEGPAAARRRPRTGCASTCPRAAARRSARPRRWTRSSTRPGTSCATATRTTTRRRSTARSSTTGTRSTSTSAASTTRRCT